jgi:alpha-glucoside transport system substrate-binding protein
MESPVNLSVPRLTAAVALAATLAACSAGAPSASSPPTASQAEAPSATAASGVSLSLIGPWRSSEADAFQAVLDTFKAASGITVVYEGVDSVTAPLSSRIAAGSPPDLAILPAGVAFQSFVKQGALLPLNDLRSDIDAGLDQSWVDALTIDGQIYAVPTRANAISLLWYNPATLTDLGIEPPTTWDELIATCDAVKAKGKSCFSFPAKDGWPLQNLFDTIYTTTYGAAQHRDLFTGKLAFTDQTVLDAIGRLTTMLGDEYAAGGRSGVLGTGVVDGIARIFGPSADSVFVAEGNYVGGIALAAVDSNLQFGKTLDFVRFPGSGQGGDAIVTTADILVMLKDSPAARSFVTYMVGDDAATTWASQGYNVANKHMDASKYSDPLAAKVATLMQSSTGEWVLLPGDLGSDWIELLQGAVLDPNQAPQLLEAFQAKAQATFGG